MPSTLDRITNGIARPLSGWISDHFGRENTMFGIFALEAVGVWALSVWGHDPMMFVVLGGLVFLAWGEVASLFPTTCTDYFGAKYATTNAGLLYTAKGTASMMVPLASLLAATTGHWHAVFMIAVAMNAAAALLAIAVLRPLRVPRSAMHDRWLLLFAGSAQRTRRAAGCGLNGRSHGRGFRPESAAARRERRMDFEYSDRTKALLEKLNKFMDEVIYPAEPVYEEQMEKAKDRWQLPPVIEECKAEAKKRGLWNMFLPADREFGDTHGTMGLSNLEYAPICEVLGRSAIASEASTARPPIPATWKCSPATARPSTRRSG